MQSEAMPETGSGAVLFPSQPDDRQLPIGSRDITLLKRAVREGWDIPEEARALLPKIALGFAKGARVNPLNGKTEPVSQTAQLRAMQILLMMQQQNDASGPAMPDESRSQEIDLNLADLSLEELRLLEKALGKEQSSRGGA